MSFLQPSSSDCVPGAAALLLHGPLRKAKLRGSKVQSNSQTQLPDSNMFRVLWKQRACSIH